MTSGETPAARGETPAPGDATTAPGNATTVRAFGNDDADWWRVRELLVASFAASPPSWNWDIRRWDGNRFHRETGRLPDDAAAAIGLWEDPDGRLVGAVHGESGGDAYLELDPARRDVEAAMLEWAEAHLAATGADGRRILEVFTWDHDEARRAILAARGYRVEGGGGCVRWLRLADWTPPPATPPPGYTIRATTPADGDAARMAALLNAAFGRTVHTAAEYRTFMDRSPSFEHELNLVAEAPDGTFASHVGLTLDAVNRHGIVEPVCTHPDHLRRGLARTLMAEGLRRVRDRGARTACVDTGDAEAANAFYDDFGFHEAHRGHTWRLELPVRPAAR